MIAVPSSRVSGSFQRSNLFSSHFGKKCSLVLDVSSTTLPQRKPRVVEGREDPAPRENARSVRVAPPNPRHCAAYGLG